MPVWLLTGLLGLKKAFAALFALAARYPWQAACIALLCLSAWLWHGKSVALSHLHACETGRKADRAAYVTAQEQALAKAKAAKAATEQHYRDLAERADHEADKAVADARSDAQRYIDAHRVPARAPGSAGGTATAPGHSNSGVPESVSADRVVLDQSDVFACSEATAYALKAREWALSLAPTAPH